MDNQLFQTIVKPVVPEDTYVFKLIVKFTNGSFLFKHISVTHVVYERVNKTYGYFSVNGFGENWIQSEYDINFKECATHPLFIGEKDG